MTAITGKTDEKTREARQPPRTRTSAERSNVKLQQRFSPEKTSAVHKDTKKHRNTPNQRTTSTEEEVLSTKTPRNKPHRNPKLKLSEKNLQMRETREIRKKLETTNKTNNYCCTSNYCTAPLLTNCIPNCWTPAPGFPKLSFGIPKFLYPELLCPELLYPRIVVRSILCILNSCVPNCSVSGKAGSRSVPLRGKDGRTSSINQRINTVDPCSEFPPLQAKASVGRDLLLMSGARLPDKPE